MSLSIPICHSHTMFTRAVSQPLLPSHKVETKFKAPFSKLTAGITWLNLPSTRKPRECIDSMHNTHSFFCFAVETPSCLRELYVLQPNNCQQAVNKLSPTFPLIFSLFSQFLPLWPIVLLGFSGTFYGVALEMSPNFTW